MDILDIFLDILLKPPQPLIGLFFHTAKVCILTEGYKCLVFILNAFGLFVLVHQVVMCDDYILCRALVLFHVFVGPLKVNHLPFYCGT